MNDNGFKISIETTGLESSNNEIKNKRRELNELLERQKQNIEKLNEAWRGNVGDEAYERLTNHSKTKYESYLSQYDRRTSFVSSVIEKYSEFDDITKKKIDEMFDKKA